MHIKIQEQIYIYRKLLFFSFKNHGILKKKVGEFMGKKNKKIELKEGPFLRFILACFIVFIIMLSGYGILSNFVHMLSLNEKVTVNYSSGETTHLRTVLQEMNTNLITLNRAKGSTILSNEEFLQIKKNLNETIESLNQLSYLTENGIKEISLKSFYDLHQENSNLLYMPVIDSYRILEKVNPDYKASEDTFLELVYQLMKEAGQIENRLYQNFRYTSWDDHNMLGSVSIEEDNLSYLSMGQATNYAMITSQLLKTMIAKGGLYDA